MRLSHILVFVIVLIVIFGASKLPEIARNLGKSAKILKEEMQDLQGGAPGSVAASSSMGEATAANTAPPVPDGASRARQVADVD